MTSVKYYKLEDPKVNTYLRYVLYKNCIMNFKFKANIIKVFLFRNTYFTRAIRRPWVFEAFYCGNDFYIIKMYLIYICLYVHWIVFCCISHTEVVDTVVFNVNVIFHYRKYFPFVRYLGYFYNLSTKDILMQIGISYFVVFL